MIVTGIVIGQTIPPDNNSGGVTGPCDLPVSKPNTLFDVGDPPTKNISHIVTVGPDDVYVIRAQGIGDNDELVVETVTGCGLGDMFECYRSQCGCVVKIDCGSHTVILRHAGRYRLRVLSGVPGNYRITSARMNGASFTELGMSCGCSGAKSASSTVDEIIGSPSAMAGLCVAMKPCITAAVADAPAVQPTNIVSAVSDDPVALGDLCQAMGPCLTAAVANSPTVQPTNIVSAISGDPAALGDLCQAIGPCVVSIVLNPADVPPSMIVDNIKNSGAALNNLCQAMGPCIVNTVLNPAAVPPSMIVDNIKNDAYAINGLCQAISPCVGSAIKNDSSLRGIHMSTIDPTSADGADGDVWFKYV